LVVAQAVYAYGMSDRRKKCWKLIRELLINKEKESSQHLRVVGQ